MISGYRSTKGDIPTGAEADAKAFAAASDAAYKTNIAAGGAVWKYATFGFGDVAIQQVSKKLAYGKLRGLLKNDGFEVKDISTPGESLWRVDAKDGTTKFINPERITQGTQVRNLAELFARWDDSGKYKLSANDQLAYNIGGSIGAFARFKPGIDKATQGLAISASMPVRLGTEAARFGVVGAELNVIKQLEQHLSTNKPFSLLDLAKDGGFSAAMGLGAGSIKEAAAGWRIHKLLASATGKDALVKNLSYHDKHELYLAGRLSVGIEDAEKAKDLLPSVRLAEQSGMAIKDVPPSRILEKIIARPRLSVDQWHKRFDKSLGRIAEKLDDAAKDAVKKGTWKPPTMKDLPVSFVEGVGGKVDDVVKAPAEKGITVYRGTGGRTDIGIEITPQTNYYGVGTYYTTDREYATMFGKNIEEKVVELKNPFIVSAENADDQIKSLGTAEQITSKLTDAGYDSIIINAKRGSEVIVFPLPAETGFTMKDSPPELIPGEHPLALRSSAKLGKWLGREPTIRESLYYKKAKASAIISAINSSGFTQEDYTRLARAEYKNLPEDKIPEAAEIIKAKVEKSLSTVIGQASAKALASTEQIMNSIGLPHPEARGIRRFRETQARPLSLLELMGDFAPDNITSKTGFWDVSDALDIQDRFTLDGIDQIKNGFKQIGISTKELENFSGALAPDYMVKSDRFFPIESMKLPRYELKLSSGKKVNMTAGELHDIVMHMYSPETIDVLLTSKGFELEGKRYPQLTKKDLEKSLALLTDVIGKNNVDGLGWLMTSRGRTQRDFCNIATLSVDNVERFPKDPYWRVVRADHLIRLPGKKYKDMYSLVEDYDLAKHRSAGATNPVVIGDSIAKLYNSELDHAMYGSMLQPLLEMRVMMGDAAWQEAVRKKYGYPMLNTMLHLLGSLEDPSYHRVPLGGWILKRTRMAQRAYLAGNIPVAGKQLVSGVYLLNYVRAESFAKAISLSTLKTEQEFIRKWCPQLVTRNMLGFNREVGELGARGAARKAYLGKENYDSLSMGLIIRMDAEIISGIGLRSHVFDQLKDMGIDAPNNFEEAVKIGLAADPSFGRKINKRMIHTISKSQPARHQLFRSEIGRSKSPTVKGITPFHSQKEAIIDMAMTAEREYKVDKDVGKLLKTYSLIAVGNVMIGAINFLRTRYMYGKKDQTWGDFLEDLGTSAVGLPYFGEFFGVFFRSTIRGLRGKPVFDESPINMLLAEPFEHALKAIALSTKALREQSSGEEEKGEWKWKNTILQAADELVQAILIWKGGPIPVYRMAKELIVDKEDDGVTPPQKPN